MIVHKNIKHNIMGQHADPTIENIDRTSSSSRTDQ